MTFYWASKLIEGRCVSVCLAQTGLTNNTLLSSVPFAWALSWEGSSSSDPSPLENMQCEICDVTTLHPSLFTNNAGCWNNWSAGMLCTCATQLTMSASSHSDTVNAITRSSLNRKGSCWVHRLRGVSGIKEDSCYCSFLTVQQQQQQGRKWTLSRVRRWTEDTCASQRAKWQGSHTQVYQTFHSIKQKGEIH